MKLRILHFLALVLLSACAPQPEKPIELKLTVAKSKIRSGEYPWYLLQVTNVGRKPLHLQGDFWHIQEALKNGYSGQSKFQLEIIGPEGWNSRQLSSPWGFHGEMKFWTSDCGGGVPCQEFKTPRRLGRWPWSEEYLSGPYKILKAGETWAATPSMVAPIRPRDHTSLDDPGDMRDLPSIPKEWSPEKVRAVRKWWKHEVESTGHLMGEAGFLADSKEESVERPRGYRVLELYSFDMPGRYRMRFIHDPVPGLAPGSEPTRAEIRDLEGHMISRGWPKETRESRYYTNWVEFEVVPSSFPKHLFKPSIVKNPRRDSLSDKLEKALKDSQIWAEDSHQERRAKKKKAQEEAVKAREKDAKIKVLMQKYSERGEK